MSDEKLEPTDLVGLYSFFESNGSQDKTLMIAVVSPLLTIFAGIIGYLTSNLVEKGASLNDAQLSGYAIFALAGFVISCFVAYVVKEFLVHAEEHFRKADSIGKRLNELAEREGLKCYTSQDGNTEKPLFFIEDKTDFHIIRQSRWAKIGNVFIVFYVLSLLTPILFLVMMSIFIAFIIC